MTVATVALDSSSLACYIVAILHRPLVYTDLAFIMGQCVARAVVERGYKYGGIDFELLNRSRHLFIQFACEE